MEKQKIGINNNFLGKNEIGHKYSFIHEKKCCSVESSGLLEFKGTTNLVEHSLCT